MNSEPSLEAFTAQLQAEQIIGQVLLRRRGAAWALCHVEDRAQAEERLDEVPCVQLRAIAQFTVDGAFRPLKSAPNLRRGWRARADDAIELGAALNHLYPGFVADWHAMKSQRPPPVTDFRPFAQRQTGMYRIVAMLGPSQAARVVHAHCAPRFCLKSRAWSVEGLALECADQKSVIPCLAPCAVLLEFARKAMRLEQAKPEAKSLPAEEWETVTQALRGALEHPAKGAREAEFSLPLNPRRLQLTLEKLEQTPVDYPI